MKENCLTGKFTDVKIVCHDDRTFKCHRHTLAAAIPYFDAMFNGNFLESHSAEVKLDSNIDGATFELLLQYIHSGSVAFIDDSNVYNLLKASDILGLESVVEACAHYFSERVPTDSVFDIVQYVCAIGKKSLILVISRFLMRSLEDSTVSQIPFPELGTLLCYFRPNSLVEEKNMLENIFKWVQLSDSTPATNTPENQKASFIQVMKNYFNLSAEFVEEYFDKMMVDICETYKLDRKKPLSTSPNLGIDCSKSNMFLYACGEQTIRPKALKWQKGSTGWSRGYFSLPGSFIWNEWEFNMRSTIIDNSRYSLYTCPRNPPGYESCEFSRHSSGLVQFPKDPPFVYKKNVRGHICSNERTSIYAFANNNSNSLCNYDCQLDQWWEMDTGDDFCPRAMTWYDGRLYIFSGQSPTSITTEMRAYDPRTGQFAKFFNCNQLYSGTNFECTNHRGQIYVANLHNTHHDFNMEIFDPVAGKRMNFIEANYHSIGDCEYRLLSFDGELWAFHCGFRHSIHVRRYDSCRQLWKDVNTDMLCEFTRDYDTNFHLVDAVTGYYNNLTECSP